MFGSLVLLALLGATTSHAAEREFQFGLYGGYFWTDPVENLDSTWAAVPRFGFGVHERLTFELDGGFHQGVTRASETVYNATTPRLNLLIYPYPQARVRPFMAVGPGLIYKNVRRDADVYETEANESGWGNYKNPDTDFLVNVGPGLEIPITPGLALRSDFRYVANVGTEPHGEYADFFNDWEWTAGFNIYPQAGRRDKDFDGIVDHEDECPEEPEDLDGYQDIEGCPDYDNDDDGIVDVEDDCPLNPEDEDGFRDDDGCPEEDNDNDGLLDPMDACPSDPEDLDGFQDRDGCPDYDNDRDGVADVTDSCPNSPEDVDGWEDPDGCPDLDNDGDAIQDVVDDCPLEPEIYNGVDDEDGCPDDLPEEIERFTGVIRGINFEVDRAVITVDSYPILNEAADVLGRYPYLRIEIQGHTDSDASNEHNLDLSARRAQAVVTYLTGRGVGSDRLEWIGYGEDRPLVPNDTEEGKAVNRRVEFHVLDPDMADPASQAPD